MIEYRNIEFSWEEHTCEPLQEEASTRRYYLVKNSSLFPEDFVVCKDIRINSDFLELTRFFSDKNLRVPKILGVDSEQNLIFQELGGIRDLSSLEGDSYLESLEEVVDFLVEFHSLEPHSIVRERDFDFAKLWFEIGITREHFQKWKEKYDLQSEINQEMVFFLEEVARFLDTHPERVLTHRDFHSRNLLLPEKIQSEDSRSPRSFFMIDYQDARMGVPQYDLSSILYDAYKPIPTQERLRLLDCYKERSNRRFFKFKETFYIQSFQRSFKALGTYLIQVGEKNNPKFLPSLFHCLDNIQEIAQLGHLPDDVFIFAHQFSRDLMNIFPEHKESFSGS